MGSSWIEVERARHLGAGLRHVFGLRGGLVDHAALAEALAENRIAGAGLDVQDCEPPDLSQPPYNDPRVIVTPHVAFYSSQATEELRTRVARQAAAFLRGERPENIINPHVLSKI